MKRDVRFDNMDALAEIVAGGFGGWGPPVTISPDKVSDFCAVSAPDPLGAPVPGFLLTGLLSLLSPVIDWEVSGYNGALNLGCPTIRFPTPVTVNSAVRGRMRLAGARAHSRGTIVTLQFDVRAEGATESCLDCSMELLYLGGCR